MGTTTKNPRRYVATHTRFGFAVVDTEIGEIVGYYPSRVRAEAEARAAEAAANNVELAVAA